VEKEKPHFYKTQHAHCEKFFLFVTAKHYS